MFDHQRDVNHPCLTRQKLVPINDIQKKLAGSYVPVNISAI